MSEADEYAKAAQHDADKRIKQVMRESRHERELLVKTALRSMRQLRSHLTLTLSGLRTVVKPDPHEARAIASWKDESTNTAQLGVISQAGETIVVRFEPPTPPLHVRPLPPTPRPATVGSTSPRQGMRRSRFGSLEGGLVGVERPQAVAQGIERPHTVAQGVVRGARATMPERLMAAGLLLPESGGSTRLGRDRILATGKPPAGFGQEY